MRGRKWISHVGDAGRVSLESQAVVEGKLNLSSRLCQSDVLPFLKGRRCSECPNEPGWVSEWRQ